MPRNPLPGNLMLKPSFPALEGETFSLPPAAKPSPLQPPPPPPPLPQLRMSAQNPAAMCQSLGLPPTQSICCYRAQVLLVLVLGTNTPWCQLVTNLWPGRTSLVLSCCHKPPVQVVLQQFMGLKSSFHLTALLRDSLHLQSKLFPRAMLPARTTFYPWPFPLGSVFAASLIWSPRERASKNFASCHSMTAGLRHGNSPHRVSFTGIKVIAS